VIEKNCLIGAGSVVVHNTKENGIYLGVPVVFSKYINEIDDYKEYK